MAHRHKSHVCSLSVGELSDLSALGTAPGGGFRQGVSPSAKKKLATENDGEPISDELCPDGELKVRRKLSVEEICVVVGRQARRVVVVASPEVRVTKQYTRSR